MRLSIKPRLAVAAAAAAIGLFAFASSAQAADYCVGPVPGGCGAGTVEPDLQTALDAAALTINTGDRVLIGPGTYSDPDGFVYTGNNSSNPVEIRGVGTPLPTLTMTTSDINKAVLNSGYAATVADLKLDVPNQGTNSRALYLGGLGVAQNLTITGPATPTGLQTGIQTQSSATVSDVNIDMSVTNAIGIYLNANSGTTTVSDSSITAARGFDIAASAGTTAVLRRDLISANYDGILMYYGDVDIDNSLIDLRGGSGEAIHMDTVDTTYDLNTIDANELTIRNGNSSSVGVRQLGDDANSTQTINLRDSIIWDVGHPFVQDTPAVNSTYTINSFNMDYDQADNLPLAGALVAGQVRTETTINTVDPGFLNPISGANGITGDYRLAFDSLMIDKDNFPINPGEFDIRGLPRIVDGTAPFDGAKRDLGAYEYQRVAPVAQATAGAGLVGQAINFDGSGSSDVDGDPLTYAWSFDDGETATGPTVTHAFSTAGAQNATLTVTDATGLTGTTNASASVAEPPAPVTGQQAAALRKCKKIKNPVKRRKCKKRARRLPL